jgi:hypothetical protein
MFERDKGLRIRDNQQSACRRRQRRSGSFGQEISTDAEVLTCSDKRSNDTKQGRLNRHDGFACSLGMRQRA